MGYGWVIDRTTVQRSITLARFGRSSQTSRPGRLGWIDFSSPRVSGGAAGFISTVSSGLGEQYRWSKMQDRARPKLVEADRGGAACRSASRKKSLKPKP